MDGWKTWVAVISSIIYGVGYEGVYNNNWSVAMTYILAALSLLGLGGKLSKIGKKY